MHLVQQRAQSQDRHSRHLPRQPIDFHCSASRVRRSHFGSTSCLFRGRCALISVTMNGTEWLDLR